MILKKLQLINFRNYRKQEITLPPGRNWITGENGQGKSNLLEAIYLLSYLRAPRASRLGEVILDGESECCVEGEVGDEESQSTIRITIGEEGKKATVNGRAVEYAGMVRGTLKSVMFSPDDLYLVRGSPARRRNFMNEMSEGMSSAAAYGIRRYQHALRQRNAVLKSWERYGSGLEDSLRPWTEGLAEEGGGIIFKREEIIRRMARMVEELYRTIFGERQRVEIIYSGTFDSSDAPRDEITQRMKIALAGRLEEEKRMRTTVVGPHRDDVEIKLGGKSARYRASQGEQRVLSLCMRLAQSRYAKEETGKSPVLMLDDVLSELDGDRREKVLKLADESRQTLITTTDEVYGMAGKGEGVFFVREGIVSVGRHGEDRRDNIEDQGRGAA